MKLLHSVIGLARTSRLSTQLRVCSKRVIYLAQSNLSSSAISRKIFNIQDQDDFDERVLKSGTPVVVDFHADWCAPCKMLAPRLEAAVAAKDGKVNLAKVDIDKLTELAMDYEVEAVPSVIAVKNGKVTDKFIGLVDDDRIKGFVDQLSGK